MTDPVALSRARLAEADRRMAVAGVAEAARYYQQHTFLLGVLEDEASGRWSPRGAMEAPDPAVSQSSAAPVAPARVHAPAAADPAVRSRSIWAKATTEANSELALSEPAPPADPQADAKTGATQMPPTGSAQRSRAAWTAAVDAANKELARRGGKVSEG